VNSADVLRNACQKTEWNTPRTLEIPFKQEIFVLSKYDTLQSLNGRPGITHSQLLAAITAKAMLLNAFI
jgi:hypothetical protein